MIIQTSLTRAELPSVTAKVQAIAPGANVEIVEDCYEIKPDKNKQYKAGTLTKGHVSVTFASDVSKDDENRITQIVTGYVPQTEDDIFAERLKRVMDRPDVADKIKQKASAGGKQT